MSADLLAEFDTYYRAPKPTLESTTTGEKHSSTSTSTDLFASNSHVFSPVKSSDLLPGSQTTNFQSSVPSLAQENRNLGNASQQYSNDDFDGWGDFESPAVPAVEAFERPKHTRQKSYGKLDNDKPDNSSASGSAEAARPSAQRIRVATNDFFSGNISQIVHDASSSSEVGGRASNAPTHARMPWAKSPVKKNNVLFDADALSENDEDEFGEFEEAFPGKKSHAPDYGSFKADTDIDRNSTRHPRASSSHGVNVKATPQQANRGMSTKGPSSSQASNVSPSASNLDSWDWDAVDVPSSSNKAATQMGEESIQVGNAALADIQQKPVSADQAPPANVPPPSILLTVFPQLFGLLQSNLLGPVLGQPFSLKNRILADPSCIDFLRGYILIAVVSARIIAGRKSRWKRDPHLSQAMRIGQAGAGGKSGMKLVGVDKAEASREEREADEVIRSWKDQVGRLRSAVAVANSSIHDQSAHLTLPEISDTMPVRTANIAEGALTAPKCCFLCGLKRDERILGIDNKVEDSFGEWWVDHWGHRTCKNFWQEHESKLKHR